MIDAPLHLRYLRPRLIGTLSDTPVMLYDGESIATFGESLLAVPISMLWETP